MIDHVTLRVSDLAASARFYSTAFELLEFPGEPYADDAFHEWNDFSIAAASADKPATRGLHVGFAARSRPQVDAWWRALTDAGYRDDGPPGLRARYGPDYYGGFVLDPDGNSAEAMHAGPPRDDGGVIDHVWIRVRSLDESTHFYGAVAPAVGVEVRTLPDRVQLRRDGAKPSLSLVHGEPPTENVHLAFDAPDRKTVDEFHRGGVEAGYRSNGEPGERPEYHIGYYGAYVLDPDGHNVEAVFHDRRP